MRRAFTVREAHGGLLCVSMRIFLYINVFCIFVCTSARQLSHNGALTSSRSGKCAAPMCCTVTAQYSLKYTATMDQAHSERTCTFVSTHTLMLTLLKPWATTWVGHVQQEQQCRMGRQAFQHAWKWFHQHNEAPNKHAQNSQARSRSSRCSCSSSILRSSVSSSMASSSYGAPSNHYFS